MNENMEREIKIECLKNILIETTKTKKHLAYQILPQCLAKIMDLKGIELHSKYEEERLKYILQKIQVSEKSILDIGCNTGYFLFELIDCGAKFVTGYEGEYYHSEFCKNALSLLKISKAKIVSKYYDFNETGNHFDIVLLLNVLHHVGDDYGDSKLSMEKAKETMLEQLNILSQNTDIVVFQLGFNWKGDIKECLFEKGTKREMIEFITKGVKNSYDILSIGIPQKKNGIVYYEDLNETNIERDDSLGEFLNRPLFILKSL